MLGAEEIRVVLEVGGKGILFPRNVVLYSVSVPTCIIPASALAHETVPNINDPGKQEFSYKLSSCRLVMECTFGKLKAHWCCLCSCLDANVANTVHIIITCCILQNICEIKGNVSTLSELRTSLV